MTLNATQKLALYGMAVDRLHRKHPERGRAAAVAEAQRLLGPAGRQAVAEARRQAGITETEAIARVSRNTGTARAVKEARKAAKRAARESAIRRQITESLTAAQAPQPAPGTGLAPAAMTRDELDAEYLAAGATGMRSPFWHGTAVVADSVTAPEAAKPLHSMSTDEFRDYAADALTAHGRASGFGSPAWQEG